MGKIIEPLPHKSSWSSQNFFSWLVILLPPAIYFYLIYSYSLNLPFADDFTILSQAISIFQSANLSENLSILFSQDVSIDWLSVALLTPFPIFCSGRLILSFLLFSATPHCWHYYIYF